MDPFTIGLGLAVAGTATSIFGGFQSNSAQKDAIKAQQKAEAIRERAITLDASRRRREIIRQGMILRSQALATGVARGAQDGSALPGSFAQIGGQVSFNLAGVNENEQLGHELFAANRELLDARMKQGDAETISNVGRGLSSLGGAVIGNLGAIDRLTNTGPTDVAFGSASRSPGYTTTQGGSLIGR